MNKDYIRNLKIRSANQKLIGKEFDIAAENKKLMEGIVPSIFEERPNQLDNRDELIEVLKQVTYEPKKFFTMLYDKYEIAALTQYLPQFMKSIGRYRTNLSANQLYRYWEEFKDAAFDASLKIAGVESIGGYSNLNEMEKNKRNIQENLENIEFNRINKIKEIEKKMTEISKKIILLNTRASSSTFNTAEFTRLNDRLMELDEEKKELLKNMNIKPDYLPFNSEKIANREINRNTDIIKRKLEREKTKQVSDMIKKLKQLNNEYKDLGSIYKTKDQINRYIQVREEGNILANKLSKLGIDISDYGDFFDRTSYKTIRKKLEK